MLWPLALPWPPATQAERCGSTGLSEPRYTGETDEPWLVHHWTLMLLSLSFSPFCPSRHQAVLSKSCRIRTTCSSLATVKHRKITASTSPPAKPSRRWDNRTPVCHLAPLSVCLYLLSVCLSTVLLPVFSQTALIFLVGWQCNYYMLK